MKPQLRSILPAAGTVVLLLIAPLSCGGDAAAEPPTPVDDRTAAQEQFDTFCITCHGKSGKGDGAAAATLDPKPRNWTDKEWQASVTDERIRNVIRDGGISITAIPLHATFS